MHRLGDELLTSAVIHLTLTPVVLFLDLEPFWGQELPSERVATSLQDLDHVEGVLALRLLNSKPALNSAEEGLCRRACGTSPGPALAGFATGKRHFHDPATPKFLHP